MKTPPQFTENVGICSCNGQPFVNPRDGNDWCSSCWRITKTGWANRAGKRKNMSHPVRAIMRLR